MGTPAKIDYLQIKKGYKGPFTEQIYFWLGCNNKNFVYTSEVPYNAMKWNENELKLYLIRELKRIFIYFEKDVKSVS